MYPVFDWLSYSFFGRYSVTCTKTLVQVPRKAENRLFEMISGEKKKEIRNKIWHEKGEEKREKIKKKKKKNGKKERREGNDYSRKVDAVEEKHEDPSMWFDQRDAWQAPYHATHLQAPGERLRGVLSCFYFFLQSNVIPWIFKILRSTSLSPFWQCRVTLALFFSTSIIFLSFFFLFLITHLGNRIFLDLFDWNLITDWTIGN